MALDQRRLPARPAQEVRLAGNGAVQLRPPVCAELLNTLTCLSMTTAEALVEAYLKYVEVVYGSEEVPALRAVATDNRAYLEPETWMARIQAAVSDLQARKPPTDIQLERGLPILIKAKELLASPSEYDERLLQSEPGSSFLAFLHDALERLGAHAFIATADAIDALGWHKLIVPGLNRDLEAVAKSFEAASKVTAEALRQGVEAMYKPMLRAALAMTPTRKGDPLLLRANVPDEVGKVAAQCRVGWTRTGGPLGVLDDDLVLVRNSVAHSATEYDVVNQKVTFVNKSVDTTKKLGPLNREAMGALVKRLYDLIATMSLAYRRVTLEARSKMAGTERRSGGAT